MSVDEARAEVVRVTEDWVTRAGHREQHAYRRPEFDTAIDRLILEVQAEMPCYWKWDEASMKECSDEWPDGNIEFAGADGWGPEGYCKTCTARMKLGETADAR